jgi:hypothetical protein
MKRKIALLSAIFLLVAAFGAFAADLTIDYQMNVTAKDDSNNYLSFAGKPVTVAKDQFVAGADAVSGASKLESTSLFNLYRFDIYGGKLLPGALRYFFLYPVAGDATRLSDGLNVTKATTGALTIRFVHRGTAFEFTTDNNGKFALPGSAKTRVIASGATVATDFSATAKVADIDWAKVWDATIADGKQIGSTAGKIGKINTDVADSKVYQWAGVLQFNFDGKILKVSGDLYAQKQ